MSIKEYLEKYHDIYKIGDLTERQSIKRENLNPFEISLSSSTQLVTRRAKRVETFELLSGSFNKTSANLEEFASDGSDGSDEFQTSPPLKQETRWEDR